MDKTSPPTLAEQIAATQAWWREAGVDYTFHDEPQGWLTDPSEAEPPPTPARPVTPVPIAAPKPRIGGDPASWPHDLAGFHRWWLEEPSLDIGGLAQRVAPRGVAKPELMLLVPMPEAGDAERLLSGPEGRLIASLVAAMGLSPERVYHAAALPRHLPLPDWTQLSQDGLGDVLAHHIALVEPRRLIVLGTRVLPLLGHDPAQAAPGISELAIQGRKLPVLASFAPERLLGNARQRAALWRSWLDWTDEGTA